MKDSNLHIGFISTRLFGTDGVSLEVDKWVEVLHQMGHQSYCFTGLSDWPVERSYLVNEAYFKNDEIQKINVSLFEKHLRTEKIADQIQKLKKHLKAKLYEFIKSFEIDLFIVENVWSLPLNIPLGVALSEFIEETDLPVIAHHHDFWWDRKRYMGSPVSDYLGAAFPSSHANVQHVVINSVDRKQLSFRKGVSAALIPNVMNFKITPLKIDDYADDLRDELGIGQSKKILLQPTRIVPRKRIERAIELVKRIETDAVLVITHESGDEGTEYQKYLKEYADFLDVDIIFAAEKFEQSRRLTTDGKKIYSVADAYVKCDLVTYTSQIEGFGNAFLESVYYKKPIVISAYEIFSLDIQPHGFKVIQLNDFITKDAVKLTNNILRNPSLVKEWVENNFWLGSIFYSYEMLRKRLQILLEESFGMKY